jgi:hypothetical protein
MSLKKNTKQEENLFSRKPYLQLYFQKEPSAKFQLEPAKEAEEFYISREKKPLASTISPKKQAQRQVQEKEIPAYHLVIVLGMGNPHLALELHEKMQPGQILVMIDAEWEIVPASWEIVFQILDEPGRHIFAGENSLNLLWNYLESLPFDKLTGISYYRNQSNLLLSKDFYLQVEEKANKLFSSKMSDLLTKFEFERIWVRNTILNTIRSMRPENYPRHKILDLMNQFSGIPAVLVSAGPSLRKQCELLKKFRNKLFIFSCDTSLKVLLKFGIIPDGVMTLDAQTNSYFHFMGEDLSKIPLFADMVTSPMLLRSLHFLSVVHSMTAKFQIDATGSGIREATAGSEFAEKYLGQVGDIQSGGSVATSAFDVLRFMGFQKVFLVGQDLAYTGREIHSTGTHHNEKWLTKLDRTQSLEKINEMIVRKRQTSYVESSNGKTVLTDYVLSIYRHWFEESVKQIQFEATNISEAGAKIQGMNTISLQEGFSIFQKFPDHDFPWRKLPPWSGESSWEPIQKQENLQEELFRDLQILSSLLNQLESTKLPAEIVNDMLESELQKYPYLSAMIRKSRIYIKRHSQLEENRKKEILFSALRKEIRFLKKGLVSLG